MKCSTILAVLTATLLATPGAAQFGEDAGPDKIKKIVDEIAKEMQEIDKLLLQTGASGGDRGAAARAMSRNVERINKLLEQTSDSQGSVVRGIDELIKEIEKMGGGEKMSGQPGDEKKPGQGRQRRPGERQKNETPEMQPRDGEREQPQGKDPKGDKQDETAGANRPSSKRPDDPTENAENQADAEGWGHLPKSLDFLKHRGGSPSVPERYRKFREAFLKQGQTKPGK